jgi:hypothetical protein
MNWLQHRLASTFPRIYSLLQPAYPLEVAFAELKPGYYILAIRADALPMAAVKKIGWPAIGHDPEVKLIKILVHGNPKDVLALWRLDENAVEVVR